MLIDDQTGQSFNMPPIQMTPYQSPMNNFQGAIVMLTNPENDLYRMELALRGMTLDKDGNPKQTGQPLMNSEGINSVVGIVQSIVTQSTNMSNLEDPEIAKLMVFQLGDAVIQDLMINSKKYGINNKTARDRILTIVSDTAYITMKRALKEGERRFWKGSQQEITTRVEGMPNKAQGNMMSKLLGGTFK